MAIKNNFFGIGLAGLGLLLSAATVQAGAELGGVNLLEEKAVSAKAPAPVVESGWLAGVDLKTDGAGAKGATGGNDGFFAGAPVPKATTREVTWTLAGSDKMQAAGSAGGETAKPLVAMPAGLRPVTPGYALPVEESARQGSATAMLPGRLTQVNSPAAPVVDARHRMAAKYAGYVSRRERGETSGPVFIQTSNNVPAANTWGSPYQGQTPAGYQGPQTYNTFTGLSSYSNGYAGAPPSPVPFSGGLFQSRSAFYSQPPMTVPGIPTQGYSGGGNGGSCGGGSGGGRGNGSNQGNTTNVNVVSQNLRTGYGY
jgi:hypothetical protein